MNIALTGIPLGLFILFSLSVFIFALVTAIVLGLLAAVVFTVLAVGAALVVVLPTVMFTTGAATFFFLWGLGGYYILRWANGDKKESKEGEAPEGTAVGDSLNRITGGKLDGFMENARAQNAKNDIKGYNDRFTKPDPQPNGHAKSEDKVSSDAPARAGKPVDDAAKKATDATSGATKSATGAVGTAKGAVSG